MIHPEARYMVEVTETDEIVCRPPGNADQKVAVEAPGAVYVQTNDSGPWGSDVWWILADTSGVVRVAFPQMATGDEAVVARLARLPGFAVGGMNSTADAMFLCWSVEEPAPI